MKIYKIQILMILLSMLWITCNKDENIVDLASQNNIEAKVVDINADTDEPVLLKPDIISANANYEWIVNGEVVATTPTYKFVKRTAKSAEVKLNVIEGRNISSYIFTIRGTKSLASELNNFTINSSNGISTIGGYYWNQTYSATQFQTANFKFSHTGGVVTGYNYWDGFTISNSTDNSDHGAPGQSEGWIPYQWGCMPSNTPAGNGNFLVGYWGYYMLDFKHNIQDGFNESYFATWVKLGNDTKTYTVKSIDVAMHPWPYYGILHGDGFARKFKKGDYFKLKVYGVDEDNRFIETPVEIMLSDYINSDNGSNYGVDTWIHKTKRLLFKNKKLKYLVFQMETTDSHPQYGPNTAVYFCIGDIKIR